MKAKNNTRKQTFFDILVQIVDFIGDAFSSNKPTKDLLSGESSDLSDVEPLEFNYAHQGCSHYFGHKWPELDKLEYGDGLDSSSETTYSSDEEVPEDKWRKAVTNTKLQQGRFV